jgi:RimJ/RimL family protein N-acetyltransferase
MSSFSVVDIAKPDREALLRLYREFEPLGAAQGLPPLSEDGRQAWVDRLLEEGSHLGVRMREPERIVGHVILVPTGLSEAEIAFFVHQDHRRKRLGTRLVLAALERAAEKGLHRVWASVTADNLPALRLLRGRGFTPYSHSLPSVELEIFLPGVTPAAET